MEVLVLVVILITLPAFGYMLGKGSADGKVLTLKRENEQLNKELHILTDRDSRGWFKGGN
jgi:multisubunit Na+/H+ antiporter MnhG subunit